MYVDCRLMEDLAVDHSANITLTGLRSSVRNYVTVDVGVMAIDSVHSTNANRCVYNAPNLPLQATPLPIPIKVSFLIQLHFIFKLKSLINHKNIQLDI